MGLPHYRKDLSLGRTTRLLLYSVTMAHCFDFTASEANPFCFVNGVNTKAQQADMILLCRISLLL